MADVKDISIIPTSSYQNVQSLLYVDTDHNDLSTVFQAVTITNQTDVPIIVKNTKKGTPSGFGKRLDVGQSFFYSVFDTRYSYIKTEAGSVGTGSVIISGEQQ
jgi:hypothetical protein